MHSIKVSYANFKASFTGLLVCYIDEGHDAVHAYTAFFMTDDFFCECKVRTTEDVADFEEDILPSATAVTSNDDAYLLCWTALGRAKKAPRTSLGAAVVAAEKPDDYKASYFTHDFTDPTTWYTDAAYVADGALTDSGDHKTYTFPHANLIDSYHAKYTDEDIIKDVSGHSFRISVKDAGVAVTEQDPHTGSGGDYTIDYEAGTITFPVARDAGHAITATYHYAQTAKFVIKPPAGKVIILDLVEVNLSADVVMNDSARFQAYGLASVFAPQLGLPDGTLIPIGNPAVYKSIRDFMNGSIKSYPAYPALGGNGWRGMTQACVPLDWDYLTSTLIDSAKGMEVRITLDHDAAWGGAFATASFHAKLR